MERKKTLKKIEKVIGGLLIIGTLLFFSGQKVFGFSENIFLEIARPFQRIGFNLGESFSQTWSFFSSIGNLKKENSALMEENLRQKATIANLKDTQKENVLLRQELNLTPSKELSLAGAWVIGQDGTKLGSWLTIDKGEADGVVVGQSVVIHQRILVGKVSVVYPHQAKVTLLSDFESVINARDLETGARGVVRGEYGLGIALDMVDQTESLRVGDTIMTSGLGGGTQADLLIGKVQSLKLSEDKLFQKAVLAPAVKYQELSLVFLVK